MAQRDDDGAVMTKVEFVERFRGPMLAFMAEAWACRREGGTAFGQLCDIHYLHARRLLQEMYDALAPAAEATPAVTTNGHLKARG